jgi:hypothetical protein
VGRGIHTKLRQENLNEIDHLEDRDVDDRTKLKWMSRETGGRKLDSSGSG